MRVQPDKRKSTNLETGSLSAPPIPDGSDAREPIAFHPRADDGAVAARPDQGAAYALLAQQCRSRVDALAPRQRDVLVGLVAGYRNKQIARMLGISPRTIEIYRADMMGRLKARTLAQALHIAFVAGLTPSDTLPLGNA